MAEGKSKVRKAKKTQTCGFQVMFDNGDIEVTTNKKRAYGLAKLHEGKVKLTRTCVVGEYKDGKRVD